MNPNPALRKLGFGPDDRVLVVHADDLGMCHSTIPAVAELFEFGLTSSASAMVPCPWFLPVAAWCRAHPGADVGVHLTLTSEWETYRWRPISTVDPASGLMEADGCFPRRTQQVVLQATREAAARELRAQVDYALASGVDVTHLDTHMGTAAAAKFRADALRLGEDYRLPLGLPRWDTARWQARGMSAEEAATAIAEVQRLEEQGFPVFDGFTSLPLNDPNDQVTCAKERLAALTPGLNLLIFHPAKDSDELRAITPDWPSRVANYHTFMSEDVRASIRQQGIQIVGYRALRDLIRAA
jgi:predicted glycoside hydrolase/deacetylase ChbG (UPF0249 family)